MERRATRRDKTSRRGDERSERVEVGRGDHLGGEGGTGRMVNVKVGRKKGCEDQYSKGWIDRDMEARRGTRSKMQLERGEEDWAGREMVGGNK